MTDKRLPEPDYPWAKIVASPDTIVPHHAPFPLARRFHQICLAMLAEAVADQELPVPLQYSVLAVIDDFPGADQRRLAMLAGVDRTNIGQIIDSLAAKGLVEDWIRRGQAACDASDVPRAFGISRVPLVPSW